MRTVDGVKCLRSRYVARPIQHELRRTPQRSFRVVHYTIMNNHIHMIVEAEDREALSKGMKSLNGRITKLVNRLLDRRGTIWRDRYHAQPLSTPTQVRHALLYVLNNARRHMRSARRKAVRGWVDDRSTAVWFRDWKNAAPSTLDDVEDDRWLRTVAPKTWMLRSGWKKAGGRLDLEAVPGPAG